MTNPSNISDDANFLLSLVPFLDAHHVRTDRIEVIANRLRIMPTEEIDVDWSKAERGKFYRPSDEVLARIGEAAEGAALSEMTWQEIGEAAVAAMQSTLLKEG